MDPYPSPQDGSPPVQQFQPYNPAVGHKQRKQRHHSFHKRNSYNGQSYFENVEYGEVPRRHSGPHSCYNCGSPEHWAQDCPDPRRTVPAAADADSRPSKRQKTGGPVVTRYPVPPHVKQQRGPPRGYTQPPVTQSNYMPYGSYPPTPMSAHSQGFSPWQQSPQYTSPVQPYPPYGPYGLPTPTASNSSQFPSPVSSHSGQQYQGYFPPQPPPFPFHQDQQTQSYQSYSQYPPQEPSSRPPRHRKPYRDDVPSIAPPVEPWMEELQSLDELPASKPPAGQIIWRPANPVACPLPSTFSDCEEASPLPPLATLQPGMSVSKYILDKSPEEFACHIRDTEEWPFVMDDPVFLQIPTDCELTSVEELVFRREEVYKTHNIRILNEAEEGEVAEDASMVENVHPYDDHSPRDNFQNRADKNLQIEGKGTERGHDTSYSGHETGASSDIEKSREIVIHQSESLRPDDRGEDGHQDRSQSLERRDSQSCRLNNKRNDRHILERPFLRSSQSYLSSHGSLKQHNGNTDYCNQDRRAVSHHESESCRQPYQKKRPRDSRGSNGTPLPQDHSLAEDEQKMQSSEFLANGYAQDKKSNGTPSPTQSSLERSNRKRSMPRDSPESDNDGPRRQEDDVSSKTKRRRPQIAAAYSRRW